MESDVLLLQAMISRDEQAFQTLYKRYYNYLMVVGLRYMTDKLRVEDVINDVFLHLWNLEREVTISTGVKQYLRGAVVNKCLSILRKDKRMDYVEQHNDTLLDDSHSVDQQMDADQIKALVNKTIEAMSPKSKMVFKLSREQGKSHKEISAQMGITTKTIENHMTRALKTLRKALTEQGLLAYFLILEIIMKN